MVARTATSERQLALPISSSAWTRRPATGNLWGCRTAAPPSSETKTPVGSDPARCEVDERSEPEDERPATWMQAAGPLGILLFTVVGIVLALILVWLDVL